MQDENPTFDILMTVKSNNVNIKWEDIIEGLLVNGRCFFAGSICEQIGGFLQLSYCICISVNMYCSFSNLATCEVESVNHQSLHLLTTRPSQSGLEGKGEKEACYYSCTCMRIVFAYFVRKIHSTFTL